MALSGISPLSHVTFHKIKKFYVSPAIKEAFDSSQQTIIDALKERIAKVRTETVTVKWKLFREEQCTLRVTVVLIAEAIAQPGVATIYSMLNQPRFCTTF